MSQLALLEQYKEKIDATLATLIPPHSPFFPSLYEGGRYTLLSSGKRIRPLLTLCTAELLGVGELEAALVPACALEMVHTYSLIHDDLPAMDNDDFRRGQPTLHRIYTEGHAILVGDFLLTYAFELLAQAPHLEAEQKVALVGILAAAAGSEGMIGGQVMDIEGSPHVEKMHTLKTAALFCASVAFGATIAHASSEAHAQLRLFGEHFGKLFQMVDDVLDGDHPFGEVEARKAAEQHLHATLHTLTLFHTKASSLQELTHQVFSQLPTALESKGNPLQ